VNGLTGKWSRRAAEVRGARLICRVGPRAKCVHRTVWRMVFARTMEHGYVQKPV
jgi:hypothetical protein